MRATILSEIQLPRLPSASGVEIIGPTAYVISDDAPFLYLLDAATLAPRGQIQLFETADFGTGRIPKARKPDLEALAACTWPGRGAGLLLLGSGSTAARRRGYWLPLLATPSFALPQLPQPLDLSALYAAAQAALPAGVPLNIEAAATTGTALLLFQRGVGAQAGGWLLSWPLAAALSQLAGGSDALPAALPAARRLALPAIEGSLAGFSGATVADGQLLVTASVENTTDPVLDGEVLGSFVGAINLKTGTSAFARLAWADGRAYRGKVEGLAVRRLRGPGHAELLLVTDDDQGGSTALLAEVRWQALA